ncbi:protein YhfH [Niallia endozanthoxylica]|uniref:YhfH family protein n=1 Tax=Niallia endozanthoxylica TaxID=2036016 RepID=A0A5J5I4A6_9BACI|nr:protein YhfH [Niallia endozanthoxylica]KAA9028484.1 YhfH family protein [Niallia endozanthoxylica]
MMRSTVDQIKELPKKVCAECGQIIDEKVESFLMECDYCLSKKEE